MSTRPQNHLFSAEQAQASGDMSTGKPFRVPQFLSVVAVTVPPVAAALMLRDPRSALLTSVVLFSAIWATGLRRSGWIWVAVGALVLFAAVSPGLGLWAAASAMMAVLLIWGEPTDSAGMEHLPTVLPGLLVLSSLTVWRSWLGGWWSVAWLIVAAGVLIVVDRWSPSLLVEFFGWMRRAVGWLLGWVFFGLLAVPFVLVPWVLDRLARVDPLWSPQNWVARRGRRVRVGDSWNAEYARPPVVPRVRRAVVAFALVALVVGAVWMIPNEAAEPIPAAFAGAEWYPEYLQDIN